MILQFSSRYLDIYFCNGHYDIREDAMAKNGFNMRFGKYAYSSWRKKWRNLSNELKLEARQRDLA